MNEFAQAIHAGIDIPAGLLPAVRRHEASLSALVGSLRSAGMDEATVDRSVRSLVESYRAELVAAIGQMLEYQ